jgi:COMPASS component SWD2
MTDFIHNMAMGSITHGENQITSIDFHSNGNYLISTSKEGVLHLIDSLTGLEKKKIYTKTHGIGIAKYTHHEACVLLTSDKKSNDIRYLCMHDNKYLRFFKGHTEKVSSISMSPISDLFLSASNDKTVHLWSLESPSPIAKLQLPNDIQHPFVSYDSTGLVFGVMTKNIRTKEQSLKLFDSRNYDKGPFEEISPPKEVLSNNSNKYLSQRILESTWTDFEFSPDGSKVLVNTNSDCFLIIDGFNRLEDPIIVPNRKNDSGLLLGACYSQLGSEIISGNEDSELQIFDAATGNSLSTRPGHITPVRAVKCNPKYEVFASGCLNTVLWLKN